MRLSCLLFSELPESMVWHLTLIWRNFQPLLYQILLLFPFLFLFLPMFPLHITHFLPQFSGNVFFFLGGVALLPFFFFCFRSFYCYIFKFRDSFLSHVQSLNEPIKGILFFLFQWFWSLKLSLDSFLEFPCLCLHYPSVLAYLKKKIVTILIIIWEIFGLIIPTFLPYLTLVLMLVQFLQAAIFFFLF